MAISKVIPEIWSARFHMAFDKENHMMVAVQDRSDELPDGNKLHIGELTGSITVGDYTKDTNINDPEVATDSDDVLTLDKQRYFNIYVDDLDRVQGRPNILDEHARKAAVAIMDDVNAKVYGVLDSGVKAGNRTISTIKAADLYKTATQTIVVDKIKDLMVGMDRANVPRSGRFCITSPEIRRVLIEYLIDKGANFGSGAMQDEAFMNGAIGNVFGFSFDYDNAVSTTLGSADTSRGYQLVVGHPNATVFASQISEIEPYRPEKRFGDAIKGLYVYGTKVIDQRYLFAHSFRKA